MLIEFRVKNFRSLRDEQVLSLVASKDTTLLDTHTVATGLRAAPNLVKSAVIYGANASGKSNLIEALQSMLLAVQRGSVSDLTQPFRLDAESDKQPSEFEVSFIVGGVRYQYGFAAMSQHVVREYLLVYKTSKPQRWFERRFDETADKDIYEFGTGLKGNKKVWESVTRAGALFLSRAVEFNSKTLFPVYDWFRQKLVISDETKPFGNAFTVQMLQQDENYKRRICNLLATADPGITDVEVITHKVPTQAIDFDPITGKIKMRLEENEQIQLKFSRVTSVCEAKFGLSDESAGTRKLLCLSGPVLDILSNGKILVVDELDTSLHTRLVQMLVSLFHRPDINTGGAQLIFTTHNTSLLDAYGLFRRDQVWFVEKEADQSSTLYSLLDYSPRKNEALERGYLQGRYGAVPILDDDFILNPDLVEVSH